MVNKTLLPRHEVPDKRLSHSTTATFQLGTGFALSLANRGLGEPRVRQRPQTAWEGSMRIVEGENHRWRTRFSSDYRDRWCWNGRWMSSPTTSRTSTPRVTRPTSRCSKNT